jgi:hypothetical protein
LPLSAFSSNITGKLSTPESAAFVFPQLQQDINCRKLVDIAASRKQLGG